MGRGTRLVTLAQLVVVGSALREPLHVVLLHGHRVLDAEVDALAEDTDRRLQLLDALSIGHAAAAAATAARIAARRRARREELPAL